METTLDEVADELWQRFLKNVLFTNDCWWWQGTITKKGYGQIVYRRKKYYTHRISWIKVRGPILFGLNVCHTCDNPRCVNPGHLFLGTDRDNVLDRKFKINGLTSPYTALSTPADRQDDGS